MGTKRKVLTYGGDVTFDNDCLAALEEAIAKFYELDRIKDKLAWRDLSDEKERRFHGEYMKTIGEYRLLVLKCLELLRVPEGKAEPVIDLINSYAGKAAVQDWSFSGRAMEVYRKVEFQRLYWVTEEAVCLSGKYVKVDKCLAIDKNNIAVWRDDDKLQRAAKDLS